MSTKPSVIHLLSGGLDSVTMLYDLVGQNCLVHALLVDYGQKHVQELLFARAHCNRLGVLYTTLTLPQLRGSKLTDGTGSYVVPFRNPVLLSHAVNLAVAAGADSVTIACNADDNSEFPDCRWEVLDAMNHAIKLSGLSVEIKAPYLSFKKWKIAGMAREFGVPTSELWTCYEGGAKPCGKCQACKKLSAALSLS